MRNQLELNNDRFFVGNKGLPGSLKAARRRRMTLAWSVWFMAALFVFFQFYLQLSSGEMVHSLMKSFSLTAFGGGLLASTYYYIYVGLQTPAGLLMDRFGPRSILSIGALVACVGCFLFGLAHAVELAAIGRILMGAGAAFAFVGCLNLVSRWFPMRRFALMTSIVEAVGMMGAIIGNLWLAHLVDRIGWRECMVGSALLAGVMSICLWLIVRNTPRKKAPQLSHSADELWSGVKQLLYNPIVWLNGIFSGLVFSVVTVFIALWAVPFMELSHHLSLIGATLACCGLYVGVIVGGPVMGWLDSHYHCRRLLMSGSVFFASTFLFAIIFWMNLSYEWLCILLFLTGFAISSYVLTFAVANEIAMPANRATCIGLTNMLCVGFAPILQPMIGFLIRSEAHTTALHFAWSVSLVPFLMLAAMVIPIFLPRRQYGLVKRKTAMSI